MSDVDDAEFVGKAEKSGAGRSNDVDLNRADASSDDQRQLHDLFKKTVAPTKRRVLKPQPRLDAQRLCGQNGLNAIRKQFEHWKPSSKKNQYENLTDMMAKIENWAHRLYPKFKFDDFINRVEHLGDNKLIKRQMQMIRLGESMSNEDLDVMDCKENGASVDTAESFFPFSPSKTPPTTATSTDAPAPVLLDEDEILALLE